jgi:hypothetical protein
MEPASWDELARVLAPGASLSVLLGGVTSRCRGARVRRLVQRLAYGQPSADQLPAKSRLNFYFGNIAISGTLNRVDDEWGYAFVWSGSRAE